MSTCIINHFMLLLSLLFVNCILDFTRMLYDLFHSSLTDVLDPEDAGEFCATLVSSLVSDTAGTCIRTCSYN